MPSDALIEVRDLSRRDPQTGRLLLNRVDVTIGKGERIALAGPSGSGKSTLLRSIVRLDVCESGSLLFRGEAICKDAIPAYRRQVIYLPQRPSFIPGTVGENLRVPFRLQSSTTNFDEEDVVQLLSRFDRKPAMLDQAVDKLSGGEQQILALIRALSLSPVALLLDEPTAALDPTAREQFEKLVLAWQLDGNDAREGRAVVWTSHDADQLDRMTTRQVMMSDGIVLDGMVMGESDGV